MNESREEAQALLESLIERGKSLAAKSFDTFDSTVALEEWRAERRRWLDYVKEALIRVFTTSAPRDEFARATTSVAFAVGGERNLGREFEWDQRYLRNGINVLQSLVERLDLIREPATSRSEATAVPATSTRNVFVVHGRDDGLRETVARFLERLDFNPIILAEQPNQGQTLIEKFEANALDVGFAVVLLTPDDYAVGPEDGDFPPTPNRARQNVILELGYFMGRLGRARVAALYKPSTETPSDIHGLAYVPMSGDGWRFELAKELRAAGYEIDFNLLA